MSKSNERDKDKIMLEIQERYNSMYYSAIKCTPAEAIEDINGIAKKENSYEGKYNKRFKSKIKVDYKNNDKVLIAQNENLKNMTKLRKGRFYGKGRIIEKCGHNSYLVKKSDGRIVKKNIDELKLDKWGETAVLEGGC